MRAELSPTKSNRAYLEKAGMLCLFVGILTLNQACQFTDNNNKYELALQDDIRSSHAQEILSDRGGENVKEFDGDVKFIRYIENYVRKQNRKIDAKSFTETLLRVSKNHSYDPIFILAVIQTESSFKAGAIGSAGEIGLMQIKPDTAKWICEKNNIEWRGAQALKDPEYNILVGAHYFHYLKNTLKSKGMKYINAYNMGLGSLKRMPTSNLKKHPYFPKVVGNYLSIYSVLRKIKSKQTI